MTTSAKSVEPAQSVARTITSSKAMFTPAATTATGAPLARRAWVPRAVRVPGALTPAVAATVEAARYVALEKLRGVFAEACASAGCSAEPLLAFERWRWSCKAAEEARRATIAAAAAAAARLLSKNARKRARAKAAKAARTDPLLPAGEDEETHEQNLVADLLRAGAAADGARAAAAQLARASKAAAAQVAELERQLQDGTAPVAKVRVEWHRHSVDLSVVGRKLRVTLLREAYARLLAMHARASPDEAAADESVVDEAGATLSEPDEKKERTALHCRLIALLLRYKAIRGHGFQAAVGPHAMDLLLSECSVGIEMFASPLNARLPAFCSAFTDVDAPFGSCGSAFALNPEDAPKGEAIGIEVNPPFVVDILDRAAERVGKMLEAAVRDERSLTMVAFYPGWTDCAGWQALSGSPHLRRSVLIAAADHGYCDGAAFQRRDPFRASPYDTTVFFLQSPRAARDSPLPEGLEARLCAAMAEARPTVAAAARQAGK